MWRLIFLTSLMMMHIGLGQCLSFGADERFPPARTQTPCNGPATERGPQCGCEITCTDRIFQLGNATGICLKADCAGIIAILHKRNDEASFRRRFVSYRHYGFEGRFVLKDQGILETGPVRLRELFLVLPGDLIEFKLEGEDCFAGIEVRSLGFIRKGNLWDLQRWLAEQTFMEMPNQETQGTNNPISRSSHGPSCGPPVGTGSIADPLGGLMSLGKRLGIFPH